MRKLVPLVLLLVLALLAATHLPADAAIQRVQANLYGFEEVPGPGDPDGTGYALFTMDPSNGSVCYRLFVSGITPATAAHIHRGAAGVAGPVVIGLQPPTSGQSINCTTAAISLINEILGNPGGFYVNVHNAQYPAGAIRGQLRPSP
jgi:hypothetical protein